MSYTLSENTLCMYNRPINQTAIKQKCAIYVEISQKKKSSIHYNIFLFFHYHCHRKACGQKLNNRTMKKKRRCVLSEKGIKKNESEKKNRKH